MNDTTNNPHAINEEVNHEMKTVAVMPPAAEEIKLVPEVKEVHRTQLKSFMEERNNVFMGIDFVKLDGKPRTLLGRLGVTAPLKGGENKVEADSRPYLTIYDMHAKGYRTVNLATVSRVRADGCVYDVID